EIEIDSLVHRLARIGIRLHGIVVQVDVVRVVRAVVGRDNVRTRGPGGQLSAEPCWIAYAVAVPLVFHDDANLGMNSLIGRSQGAEAAIAALSFGAPNYADDNFRWFLGAWRVRCALDRRQGPDKEADAERDSEDCR